MKRNLLIILVMAFVLVVVSICPMVSAGPTLPFEKIKSIAMIKGKLVQKGVDYVAHSYLKESYLLSYIIQRKMMETISIGKMVQEAPENSTMVVYILPYSKRREEFYSLHTVKNGKEKVEIISQSEATKIANKFLKEAGLN
jgi:hypothetical protein